MPTAAEALTLQSSPDEVSGAINSCISQMMGEGGRSQEQVIAICHSMARTATGKPLNKKATTVG